MTSVWLAAVAAAFILAAAPAFGWAYSQIVGAVAPESAAFILAGAVGALVGGLAAVQRLQPLGVGPAAMMAVGAIGAACLVNLLPQLALSSALAGVYGLSATIPSVARRWRGGVFVALLIALTLPFGVSQQTGAGFFLRAASADAAANILALAGVASLTAHDVLIFENSIAQVDAPCSGLKSVFTGAAFFLAASAVMRRRLTIGWAAAFGAFLTIVLAGNIARIVILAGMNEGGADALAERAHIPLGILFFAVACAAGVFLISRLPPHGVPSAKARAHGSLASPLALAGAVLALTIAPPPPALIDSAMIATPTTGVYAPLELTAAEARFYDGPGAAARKWRFEAAGLEGSILIVRTSALTAMHAPEICFEANGFRIVGMETETIGAGALRRLALAHPNRSAIYWMQSETTVTDSFTQRLARYARKGENDWVMVTILFENDPNPTVEKTMDFARKLTEHVAAMLAV